MLAVVGAIIFALVVLMAFGLVHLYTLSRRVRQLTVRVDLLTAAHSEPGPPAAAGADAALADAVCEPSGSALSGRAHALHALPDTRLRPSADGSARQSQGGDQPIQRPPGFNVRGR